MNFAHKTKTKYLHFVHLKKKKNGSTFRTITILLIQSMLHNFNIHNVFFLHFCKYNKMFIGIADKFLKLYNYFKTQI